MWKKVDDFIIEQQMFSAGDVVIAGVSGGADSMCLLFVLEKWSKKADFKLIVTHVNHGLRGEKADEEEAYVKSICEEKGILFESRRVNVHELVEKEKISEEEAGRNLRRKVFEEVAAKHNGNKIALAHHKNDNVETFLLNLARGSRLKGLGGMKPVNGKYVRPLLQVTREEIEEYLKQRNILYCVDESNASDVYTRNRVRNHMIPFMCEQVNVKSVEHISSAMDYFREVQEYLEKQMAMLWKETVAEKEDGTILIDQSITKCEKLIGKMVLKEAIIRVAGKERDLEECHVESVAELFEKQTGREVHLPYDVQAVRRYQGVKISRRKENAPKVFEEQIFPFETEKEYELVFGEYGLKYRIFPRGEGTLVVPKKTYTKWFDYDIIKKSVGVRTRRPGDRIVIDENGNSQKLKNYFINEKVSSELRDEIPVIVEGEQVLWIVGYRQSKAYQVSERTTTILEIEINGGKADGRNN